MVQDINRIVDEVGITALPYFIFAEDRDFLIELTKTVSTIIHDCERGYTNSASIQNVIDRMHILIQEYRNHAGVDNIQTIDRYRAAISTQEDRITQLNAKVDLFFKILSDKMKPLTKEEVIIPGIVASTPAVAITIPVVAITTAKEILKPIELTENTSTAKQKSPALKCPSCGKTLKKATTKYHCFPSHGGCGKIYSIEVNGSLTEKIKVEKAIPQEIKEYFQHNKETTNMNIRNLCGVNKHQARYLLQKLVKENFIEKKGKGRSIKYVMKE